LSFTNAGLPFIQKKLGDFMLDERKSGANERFFKTFSGSRAAEREAGGKLPHRLKLQET